MSQENVELTRRGVQASNDRYLDAFARIRVEFTDNVEIIPILAAMEGGFRGHDGGPPLVGGVYWQLPRDRHRGTGGARPRDAADVAGLRAVAVAGPTAIRLRRDGVAGASVGVGPQNASTGTPTPASSAALEAVGLSE